MTMKLIALFLLALQGSFSSIKASLIGESVNDKQIGDQAPKVPSEDIHILLFETDAGYVEEEYSSLDFFLRTSQRVGIRSTTYGFGSTFQGYGDKYTHLRSLLLQISPDSLVVLSDSRDVLLNVPDKEHAADAIARFKATYRRLTEGHPEAVVVSTESQCCVAALAFAAPGDYFDAETGKRNMRACNSGEDDCVYEEENENVLQWQSFMENLVSEKTHDHSGSVYLNAGLMVGSPSNLLRLLDRMALDPTEDDQAVLTGLLHHDPESVVLDYDQELFGNNDWRKGLDEGCVFHASKDSFLTHKTIKSTPLVVHANGQFFGCLDKLTEELGGVSQERHLRGGSAAHEEAEGNLHPTNNDRILKPNPGTPNYDRWVQRTYSKWFHRNYGKWFKLNYGKRFKRKPKRLRNKIRKHLRKKGKKIKKIVKRTRSHPNW